MAESLATRIARWRFNLHPAYRRTGGRVTYIADDWREVRIRLPLNRKTRNIVGTTFGGSMYAAVDPFYMIMLMRILGSGYVVWDRAATIRFRRPGRSELRARFALDRDESSRIRELVARKPSLDRVYSVDRVDEEGEKCATVEKTIYIRAARGARGAARGARREGGWGMRKR